MATGYQPGPLSSFEDAVHDFHDRIRAACPVVRLSEAPGRGSVAALDQALRAGA